MKMFVLKSFCLLSLMFVVTLAGIRVAHNGMNELKGVNDAPLGTDFTLKVPASQTSNRSDDASHNIAAKRQQLEKMNTFNLFSFMGNELSDGISNVSKKMIHLIVN